MSASLKGLAMLDIMGLARAPDLNALSCELVYVAFWPARFGNASEGLIPAAPWQPAHIIDFAFPAAISAEWAC